MRNYVQQGEVLDAVAPAGGVVSGNAYLIGKAFGVAQASAAEGETFALVVEGVVELPIVTGALTQFSTAYWDDTAKGLTGTVGSNTKVGYLTEAKAAGVLVGKVKLIPAA